MGSLSLAVHVEVVSWTVVLNGLVLKEREPVPRGGTDRSHRLNRCSFSSAAGSGDLSSITTCVLVVLDPSCYLKYQLVLMGFGSWREEALCSVYEVK